MTLIDLLDFSIVGGSTFDGDKENFEVLLALIIEFLYREMLESFL